jgi:hypothetical protein
MDNPFYKATALSIVEARPLRIARPLLINLSFVPCLP